MAHRRELQTGRHVQLHIHHAVDTARRYILQVSDKRDMYHPAWISDVGFDAVCSCATHKHWSHLTIFMTVGNGP